MSSETNESTALFDLLGWLEVNKKRLGLGAGIAIAVGFAGWVVVVQKGHREDGASAALVHLQTANQQTEGAAPVSSEAFLKLADQNSGTRAAERALLLAAEAAFTQGKAAEAQQLFERFRKDYGSSPFAPMAAYGVAAALEAQKKSNEAQAAYQDILTRFASSSVSTQAKLALARLHEAASRNTEALKIYDELTAPGSFSSWSSEAASHKDQLLSRHPELAPVAAPSPISVSTNAAGQRITITPVATTNAAPAPKK